MNDSKKSGVAFWASVVVVVLMLYVLSVGPLLWIDEKTAGQTVLPEWAVAPINMLYTPLALGAKSGPPIIRAPLRWYMRLWVDLSDSDFEDFGP
jgi:hypothetical protein